jgi:putative selenium metabolism protein SsnA
VLIRDAVLASFDPPRVEAAELRIQDGRIVERGPALSASSGEEQLDLEGAVVIPGLVNAHTHLYSALARGMPAPSADPRTFLEILERVWWRLDRALDATSIHLSGLVGAVEAVRSGTTCLIDHHSSPSAIDGSLDALRRATEGVGLRSVLCYEVTDRNGVAGRDAGIEENRRFLAAAPSLLTRGMVGAHASFTLSEETLDRLAEVVAASGSSLHVHVAEDGVDVEDCRTRCGEGIPARFARHGLLIARTLFAHGVHLLPEEIETTHAQGGWIAHNPRSNMNNAVGTASAPAIRRGALGTDGMDQDLFAEARTAYLKMREAGRPEAMEVTLGLLAGGHRLAAALFGLPFGKLDAGGPADLVVLDYRPPTPLTTENLAGHLLFGIDRSHVQSVMVAGRWVMRDREVPSVDAPGLSRESAEAARALWQRMQAL